MIISRYDRVRLLSAPEESEAVKAALVNLKRDLLRVLDCMTETGDLSGAGNFLKTDLPLPFETICAGTAGLGIEEQTDVSCLKDEKGDFRREAFLVREEKGRLYIAGSDRRGTIYGIYDFCEWLGVSPWYFFADVPVKRREKAVIEEGFFKTDYPTVPFRGIFINDEEELENWVQRYMGEETIGVRTYEKIFELMLRLKLNYLWPAMHVNSFNVKPENGALADRMGIIIGTTHCDMLMRSNNREWYPWLKKKGYTDVEYDFSIPGRNREILKEYWRESVLQNKNYEVTWTVGMRGIHDSGFETRSLKGKTGKELLQGKIELLESVMKAQQEILSEELKEKPVRIFVPYKEVLELYDNGLFVPEDLTLIWVNDNYGYVRRYPNEQEKKRPGGHGIYYHNSYWAPPGASYLFVDSIPLSHTRNELKKAYREGIQKLWVTNFGALKPLEMQMTFYARLAWDAAREDTLTDHEEEFIRDWLDRTFSTAPGKRLAKLLVEFDQVTNARKLEQMDSDTFPQTGFGDEAADRIHFYEKIRKEADSVYDGLPAEEKDAFFQLVLMRIHAAYFTNAMFYYADRSNLCMKQGKARAAEHYTELSGEFDRARRTLLSYYNHRMSGGKWNGILTPEDFPPPRTAMEPACMPPIAIGERQLIVMPESGEKLEFGKKGKKWLEIANGGRGSISWEMELPDWLSADAAEGETEEETRIGIWPDWEKTGESLVSGTIAVIDKETGERKKIQVSADPLLYRMSEHLAVEEDGMITLEAESGEGNWKKIPGLGRGRKSLAEAEEPGQELAFRFYLKKSGSFLLELHRFPSLNSVGRIRTMVICDGKDGMLLESASNDEHRGSWKKNVRDGVDRLELQLPFLESGEHRIVFQAVDRYFAFSRAVIYTESGKKSNLGYAPSDGRLPEAFDAEKFCRKYYGDVQPDPRPVLYLIPSAGNSLVFRDILRLPEKEEKLPANRIVETGRMPAEEKSGEIRIEAAAVLAGTPYAFSKGEEWTYCRSSAHDGSGLAMYLRKEGLTCADPETAPSLHYTFKADGGNYRIWMRAWMWSEETCRFRIFIDGSEADPSEIFCGREVWCYANEQVWKWIPLLDKELSAGLHEISFVSMASGLRIGEMAIVRGEWLPR